MDSKSYTYRRAYGFLIVFGVFTYFWIGAVLGMVLTDKVTINEQTSTLANGWPALIPFVLLGLALLFFTIRSAGSVRYERIDIAGSELFWVDWRGKECLHTHLSTVRSVTVKQGGNFEKVMVVTDAGPLRFMQSIDGYGELKRRLSQAAAGDLTAAAISPQTSPFLGDAPKFKPRSFNYRGSAIHVISFPLLAFLSFWTYGFFFLNNPRPSVMEGIIGLPIIALFWSLFLYMQISGWNERIEFTASTIRWIDWRKRVRIEARFEEITGMDEQHDETNSLTIETTIGAIRANSSLRGYADLKNAIRDLLSAPRVVLATPQSAATAAKPAPPPHS